jgi:hypothetical protein
MLNKFNKIWMRTCSKYEKHTESSFWAGEGASLIAVEGLEKE